LNKTSIEWTHRPETGGAAGGFTWNPIRARIKSIIDRNRSGTFCTRISPGCTHCYASTINKRFGNGLEFTVPNLEKVEFFIDEKILQEPLRRKKPATIFVGDMFDLFHEAITDAEISYVFATMHDAPQHTFQLLTKRTERMFRFMLRWGVADENIWLGTSVETPAYKDRIDWLRATPAVVRYLSIEPQLEDIGRLNLTGISWVICGGESGPGARPFNLAWAESLQEQCKAAKVAFFMKQVGSYAVEGPMRAARLLCTTSSKGGDPSEWPESLRVRQFPSVEKLVTA
jgi:protein gp37